MKAIVIGGGRAARALEALSLAGSVIVGIDHGFELEGAVSVEYLVGDSGELRVLSVRDFTPPPPVPAPVIFEAAPPPRERLADRHPDATGYYTRKQRNRR